jgi:hypothetical protein
VNGETLDTSILGTEINKLLEKPFTMMKKKLMKLDY